MSSILIAPLRVEIQTTDGAHFLVRHAFFEENDGSLRSLHDGKPFPPMDHVEICLLAKKRHGRRSLPVPPHVSRVVAHFLSHQQGIDHEEDCYDFMGKVAGMPAHDKKLLLRYWREKRFLLWRRPGDVVFFIDRHRSHFMHAALYIGRGLYLSVYGKNGDLEFASLSDMKEGFSAREIITVIPRRA